MKIQHVVIKVNDQETFFEGKIYPHYEIGWKKGDEFYFWNGLKKNNEEIADWWQICSNFS